MEDNVLEILGIRKPTVEEAFEKHFMQPDTIFIKRNGVTKAYRFNLSSLPFLSSKEDSLFHIKNDNISIPTEMTGLVSGMIRGNDSSRRGIFNSKCAIEELEHIKDSNDIATIFNKSLENYKRINYTAANNIIKKLDKNSNLMYSIYTKRLINNYAYGLLKKESEWYIDNLLSKDIDSDALMEKVLNDNGKKYEPLAMNENILELEKKALVDSVYQSVLNRYDPRFSECNSKHKCAICHLTQNCRKIRPVYKFNIGDYQEITDGVQTSDVEGLSDRFLVDNCKLYNSPSERRKANAKRLVKECKQKNHY